MAGGSGVKLPFRSPRSLEIPILMLHGLCEQIPSYAVFKGGRTCMLPVEDFSELIQWCCKNFDVVRVSELEDLLQSGFQRYRPLLLTFDDGLASVIDHALPILRERRISAVVFVTTEWTDAGRTPPIFQLERILSSCIPTSLVLRINGARLSLELTSSKEISPALDRVWDFLFEHHFPPLKLTFEHICIGDKPISDPCPADREFWFPASWSELRSGVREGLLEIGSHMKSHTPLTWLGEEIIHKEVTQSGARLETELNCRVKACSYPHGMFNDQVRSVTAAHYTWAFSNSGGVLGGNSDRFCAPRIHVPGENWRRVKRAVWLHSWDRKGFGLRVARALNSVKASQVASAL